MISKGLTRFVVTYVQEVTQPVDAQNIGDAGAFAKQYAREHKNLRVLSVFPEAEPALPLKPAA